jgi:hypothetical protein
MNLPSTSLLVLLLCAVGACTRADELAVTFAGPDILDVRTELMHWIARADVDQQIRTDVISRWANDDQLARLSDEDQLDLIVESFAAVDPSTQRLLESSMGSGPLEEVVYNGIRQLGIYRNHVELFRARWLTQHRLFDEALQIYEQLSPEEVVDPAGLFFYRAVCQSELLDRDAALDSLSLLLNHTLEIPSRFRVVATILQKELGGHTDDDLGHVSRLMADVERQLDLGRSGERVQERQGQVIDAIDRLLKEAEKQKKQNQQQGDGQQGQGSPGQPTPGSGNPAADSQIRGWKSPGEADRREVKEGGGWGMLDRQEEAKARELIRQQFPANYLDIISEYSRRIAEQK